MTTAILSIIALPFIIGYAYGFRLIDPNTYKGKVYYASMEVE